MEEITIPTRWERVKQHVVRNRYWYAAGGLALIAGALGYSVGRASADGVKHYSDWEIEDVVESQVQIGDGNTIENHTEITNYYGHSTKIVKCLETGEIWETVGEAARSVGVSQPVMSKHLNGHTEHVYNMHYEIIGLGTTGV